MNHRVPYGPRVALRIGDHVAELGSEIRGHITGPGKYSGEWRIACDDGDDTSCLDENLVLIPTDDAGMPLRPLSPGIVSFPTSPGRSKAK